MRFIGYIVNGKKFGCGQREKAYAYAKKMGLKVETWAYKI